MNPSSRYPSPSSIATQSGSASPLKLQDSVGVAEIQVRTDGLPPPAKRRRVAERKPRCTEHLDLDNRDEAGEAQLDRLLMVLRRKKKIVVVAGAGMSVSAGSRFYPPRALPRSHVRASWLTPQLVPDFRSSHGLFQTLKDKHKIKGGGKALFDASVYRDDKSTAEFHKMVRDLSSLTKEAKPTAFHHMLATLAHEGRLMRLYSQNVDCLDTSLKPLATTIPLEPKGPWPVTIQLHGGIDKMQCTKCNEISDFDGSLFEGSEAPLCKECKETDLVRTQHAGKRSHGIGRLRPRMVLYNEYNPDQDSIGRVCEADLRRVPDAVIVVGTSLKIPGLKRIVRELCQATRAKRDGFTAWINLDSLPQTPDMKDLWDLEVRGKCDDIASLLDLPRWDCEDVGSDKEAYMVSGSPEKEEQYEQRLSRDKIDVLLDNKNRSLENSRGDESRSSDVLDFRSKLVDKVQEEVLPTPSASPRQGSPLPRKPLPKSKTKQSTLSFGAQASQFAKGSKATQTTQSRRRGRSKKDTQPKNEITKAFKSTKGAPQAGKTTKEPLQQIKNECDSSGPKYTLSDDQPGTLPSLRPHIKNVDNFVYQAADMSSSDLSFHSAMSDLHDTSAVSLTSHPQGGDHVLD